jgi:hypothetical protein
MDFKHKSFGIKFVQAPKAGDVVVEISVKYPVEDCFLSVQSLDPSNFSNSETLKKPPSALLALALQKEVCEKLASGHNFTGTKVFSTVIGSDGTWFNISWSMKATFSSVMKSVRDALTAMRPAAPGVTAAYKQLELAHGAKRHNAGEMNWCIEQFNKGLDDVRCIVLGKLSFPSVKGKKGVADREKIKRAVEVIESKILVKDKSGKVTKPEPREYIGKFPVINARGKEAFLIRRFLAACRIVSVLCKGKVIMLIAEKDRKRHVDRVKSMIAGYLEKLEKKKDWQIGYILAVNAASSAKVGAPEVNSIISMNKQGVKSILNMIK